MVPMTTRKKSDDTKNRVGSLRTGLLFSHFICGVVTTIIIRSFWEFENASEALAFYGVYHRYGWNQVIHFFGVPGLLWSLFIFMLHVDMPFVIELTWLQNLLTKSNSFEKETSIQLNYALFLAVAYGLFYLKIDPIGGTLFAPVLFLMYKSAVRLVQMDNKVASYNAGEGNDAPWYGTGQILKFAAVVHFICWFLQIQFGHKIIEGAQPALFQSLGGALTVAPLFAFYEGLWLLGINQELQDSTKDLVAEYTNEFCTSGKMAMKVCQNASA